MRQDPPPKGKGLVLYGFTLRGGELFFILILQCIVEDKVENYASNYCDKHSRGAKHVQERRQALSPSAIGGSAMVRQHNSQSQCSTGNQGIAQCTLITDDRNIA